MGKIFAIFILVLISPFLCIVLLIKYIEDGENPIYVSKRVGLGGVEFNFYKIRTMSADNALRHIVTTANYDSRITDFGHFLRKYKIDEFLQLINIINGSVSWIGPRPNVIQETSLYNDFEKKLLTYNPGLTDLASLYFANIGDLIPREADANDYYRKNIRPLKNNISLVFMSQRSNLDNILIIIATFLVVLNLNFKDKLISYLFKKYNIKT